MGRLARAQKRVLLGEVVYRCLLGPLDAGLLSLISLSSGAAFGAFVKTPVAPCRKEPRASSDGEGGIWGLKLRPTVVRASWLKATSTL